MASAEQLVLAKSYNFTDLKVKIAITISLAQPDRYFFFLH